MHWRRIVAIVAVAAVFAISFFGNGPEFAGLSIVTVNDVTALSGGSHPAPMAMGLLIWLLYWMCLDADEPFVVRKPSGVMRRFLATALDFVLAILANAPLYIVVAIREWRLTGVWQWQFERDYATHGDYALLIALMVPSFAIFILYFLLPLKLSRQTVGDMAFGIRLLHGEEPLRLSWSQALLRLLAGWAAFTAWPITAFVFKKPGQLWIDRLFETRACVIRSYETSVAAVTAPK